MRSRIFALSVVIVSLMSFPTGEMACAWGQEQAGRRSADRLDRLRQRLESEVAGFPGTVGLAVRDLVTGEEISIEGDREFPMASVYKIPIMVEVFRQVDAGRMTLSDRVSLSAADRTLGSGILTLLSDGLTPTIRDLLTLMIVLSDNEATDLLLKRVGAANVTASMRGLGLHHIRVDRTTFEMIRDFLLFADERFRGKSAAEIMALSRADEPAPDRYSVAEREFAKMPLDVASPREMALLLGKIVRGEAASRASCEMMMTILRQQMFNHRLPRYLPESAAMAHKTGTIGSTTNDAGVFFVHGRPIALVLFTVDKRVARGEVEERMGRLARMVYDYFDYTLGPVSGSGR